jgi:hypothetical protein
MSIDVNPRNIKIGDIVYFFGCNGTCYKEALFWVKVESIYLVQPDEDNYSKINRSYNMARCFPSAKEAIDHKRRWLDELESNIRKLVIKAQ